MKQKAMKFSGRKQNEGKKVDNRKLTDIKGFAVKSIRRKMKGIDMLLNNIVTEDERKGIY